MQQGIADLTGRERGWVAAQLEAAAQFVEAFAPADSGRPITLASLDRAVAAWLATEEADDQMIDGTINCVAAAFGQFLVDGMGLTWVQRGSDLVVYGRLETGGVLVYPEIYVARRLRRREPDPLEDSYRQLAGVMQGLNEGAEARLRKPPRTFL
jgi:hypothetical protein